MMRTLGKMIVPLLLAALLPACIPDGGRYDVERDRAPHIDPGPIDRGPIGPVNTAPRQQAWEARPVSPDAQDVAEGDYVVEPGDTLRGIANRTGAGSEAIARANGIAPPFTIFAGQRLSIPGGRYHLVRPGQTGIAIARAYGVDWSRIVADNGLVDPYVLRAGQRIIIPHAGPLTPAERAAAFHLDIEDIVTGGEPALAGNDRPARPTSSPSRILPPTAAVQSPLRRTGGFTWPVSGNVVRKFGPGASGERNDGIKIAVPLDTPVLATADGVVAYTGDGVAGLGGLVMLKHGDGWTSVYGHNHQILVQRGQSVKRGQAIALSGDTGFADRPELHFELRNGRTPVDPLGQLPKR
ncbi:M23 family metallopeptidase [Sphingomonas sp. 28-63-12]|uniref:M23 family metallopeptidase n=1 Tax=Sphingomonas sp. 28-63-12 TaxID=1970434 RepID=UPI000BD7E332|nr:MAG: hypothetical protein B7Y47_16435 [Sphingomonas sp. 28-63-12]